jgi:hypothetical protein
VHTALLTHKPPSTTKPVRTFSYVTVILPTQRGLLQLLTQANCMDTITIYCHLTSPHYQSLTRSTVRRVLLTNIIRTKLARYVEFDLYCVYMLKSCTNQTILTSKHRVFNWTTFGTGKRVIQKKLSKCTQQSKDIIKNQDTRENYYLFLSSFIFCNLASLSAFRNESNENNLSRSMAVKIKWKIIYMSYLILFLC